MVSENRKFKDLSARLSSSVEMGVRLGGLRSCGGFLAFAEGAETLLVQTKIDNSDTI